MINVKDVQQEIEEYNKTAYVDEQTLERNVRGYSNDIVRDDRIPSIYSRGLIQPLDQIDDERLKLILKRDYASLMYSLEQTKKELNEAKQKLESVYPTPILRFTGQERDELEAGNRLYYTEDGRECVILPKGVKLKLTTDEE